MEKNLDHIMGELINTPGVYGCVFSDNNGLCLASKGDIAANTAGIVNAIAEEVSKLEPNNKPPVIHFENDTQSCTVRRKGNVTCAIYKNLQS